MAGLLHRTSTLALLAATAACSSAQDIQVSVNGRPLGPDGTLAQEVNGRIMVPLREVLEQLGAHYGWDSASRTVTASRGGKSIRLSLGTGTVEVDGRAIPQDVSAVMLGGRVMVPPRFLAQTFGGAVTWDSVARQVRITTEVEPDPPTTVRAASRPFVRPRSSPSPRARRPASTVPLTSSLAFMREYAVIPVTLETPLSSRLARPGDLVSAAVEFGLYDSRLPRGTRFRGAVREVVPARDGRNGAVSVHFTEILFPDGTRQQVNAHPQPLDLASVQALDGSLVAKAGGRRRSMFVGSGASARLARADLLPSSLLRVFLDPSAARPGLSDANGGDVNVPPGFRLGVRLDRQISFDPGSNSEDDDG